MRGVSKTVIIILLILCAGFLLKASTLVVQSGSWAQTGNLTVGRAGASAALLSDGRILVTGGDPGTGPVPSADFFNPDGTVTPAPPMVSSRSGHISVTMQDGRVLVGGGLTAGGSATSTAEIFDPVANSWASVGVGMVEARSGATAVLLQDGHVLVAGGQNGSAISSTIEIFDPSAGNFAIAGTMSSPRNKHAMTLLKDGRVLIVGGSNGTAPVASTDIFDPVAGSMGRGPSLATARYGHSATTLLNGSVVIVGGNNGNADPAQMDSTLAEMFDPAAGVFTTLSANLATPREGHLAVLLPNNNSVLIVGGTSGGVTTGSAELFIPQQSTSGTWSYGFGPTGSLTTARTSATISPNQANAPSSAMLRNGIVMIAGGSDASGNVLNSTEAYGFATVQTDQSDYPPGTTVHTTGSGWKPGETVTIQLVESPLIDTHGPYTVVADASGNISDNSFITDAHDLNVLFYLTATGGTSGFQAQNTFTDGNDATTTTVSCTSTTIFVTGSTTCTATVKDTGGSNGAPTGSVNWSILPADGSFNPGSCTLTTGANSTSTCTTTFTASSAGNATITGSYPGGGSGSKQWKASSGTLNVTVIQQSTTTTVANNGPDPSVYGQQVSFTATVKSGIPGNFVTNEGCVQFFDGGNSITAEIPVGTGTVTTTVSTLSVGLHHNITAAYTDTGSGCPSTGNGNTYSGSTSTAVSQIVTPAALTVTANNQSKTYGQTVTFGSGSTQFTSSGLQNGETIGSVTLAVSGNGGAATAAVGSYTITPSAAIAPMGGTFTAGNYTITYNTGQLTVSPAALTVTANNQSKTYGQTVTFGSGSTQFTSSGLQNGETIGSVTLAVSSNGGAATAAVGSYTITPSAATGGTFTASNYTITYNNGTLTVNAAALTITANNQSKTYGQTVTFGPGSTQFTSSGLQNGETIVSVTITASGGTAANATVGNYTLAPSAATGGTFTASNYTITYNNGTLTVNPATLTVTATSASSTYGSALPNLTVSYGGFVNGDTSAVLSGAPSVTTTATSSSPVGTYPITAAAGNLSAANYTFTFVNGMLTITQATPTVTVTGGTFTYDGNSHPTTAIATGADGANVSGAFTFTYTPGGSTAPINAGTYSVSASFTSTNSNYTGATGTGSITINRLTPSFTKPASQAITYGTASITLSGLVNGYPKMPGTVTITVDGVPSGALPLSGNPNNFSDTFDTHAIPASATPYTITYAYSGDANSNPATDTSTTLTVNKATPTVNWAPPPAAITYGTALSSTQLNATFTAWFNGVQVTVAGTPTYNPAAGTVLGAGSQTLNVSFVPNDTTDYNNASGSVFLTVNKAVASVTPNAASKTYGTSDPAFSGTLTGFLPADNVTATYSRIAGENVSGTPYTISATLSPVAVLGNYSVTYNTANFTINKATLTVTASSPMVTYGDSVPTITPSFSGFVNGETSSVLTTQPTCTTAYTTTSNAGSSPATSCSGAAAANYSFTYAAGAVTVNQAAVTVTASSPAVTYGDPIPTITASFSAFKNGQTSSVLTTQPTCTTAYTTTSNAGSSPATTCSGAAAANYSFTYAAGAVTINKANPNISVTPYSVTYDGNAHTATGTAKGALNETLSGLDLSHTTHTNAGTYSSDYWTFTDATGNYNNVAATTITDTINKATPVVGVSFAASPITYDGNSHPATASAAGIGGADLSGHGTLTVTYTLGGSSAPVNAGSYTASAQFVSSDSNYTDASSGAPASLTINQASTTTTVTCPANVVYNGSAQIPCTASVTGAGGLSQSLTVTYANNTNAGTATASASFAGDANHTGSSGSANFTILQATPTVSFTGAPASATFGAQFVVTATTNSTASAMISASGSCAISGATVTITSGVGTCNLHAAWPADTNYLAAAADQSTAAQPAPVAITVPGTTVTYDGSPKTVSITASPAVSFSVTYTGTLGTTYGPTPTAPTEPGTYTVLAAVTDAVDYLGSSSGTLTINKKDPALVFAPRTGMPAQTAYGTRVYFDLTTTNSPCPTGLVQFFIDSDSTPSSTATLTGTECTLPVSAEFSTATLTPGTHTVYVTYAGDAHYLNETSAQVSQVVFADATMVTLATSAGEVFVGDSVTFTATVTPSTSVDASATAPAGSVQFFDGNTQLGQSALTGNTATFSSSSLPAGPHSVTATYVSANGEFKGSSSPVSVETVDKITPTITWPTPAAIVYGTKLDNTQLNATATDAHNSVPVSGTFAYNPPADTVLAVGPFNLTVAFTPADGNTYTTQTASVTIIVNPATLTVTADNASRQYGVDNAPFTFQYSGFVNNETSAVVITPPTCTSTADHTSNVGTYDIICSGGVSPNYSFNYVKGTLTVNPAPLTITANDKSKTYGDTVTFAGTEFTTSTVYNGDTVTSVTLTTPGAAATAAVGNYSITPSAAVGTGLSNYTITYANGKLTVDPAALTITAKDASKAYGQTLTFAGTEFTTSTLYNTDAVTSVTLTSAGAPSSAAAGSYSIVPSAAIGTGLSNYTITYKNGTLTVNKAHLTVTADDKSKTYDGAVFSSFTATITGFVNGETLATSGVTGTASFSGPATAAVNAGSYPITPTVGTLSAANYDFPSGSFMNGTLTINKANATVSVTPYSVTYDGNAHTATGTAKGVETPATADLTSLLHLSGTTHTNAGDYPSDAWAFDGNGNYNATSGAVHDSIAKADATISVTPYTVTYDGNAHTATGSATGVKGEALAGLDLSKTTHTSAGSYATDAWTFTDVTGNYNNAGNTVSDSIAKANATISVTPYTVTYDDNAHTAAGTATGVKGEVLSGLDLNGTTHTHAGDYAADPWTFTDGTGNYNNESGTVSDIINAATLTVTANPQAKVYGHADPVLSYVVSGLQGIDAAGSVLTGSLTRAAGETVVGSPYAISQGTLAANSNYTIHFTGSTLTITTATLTVTANAQTKVYGQPDPALTYASSGFQFSDTAASVLVGSLTRAAGETVAGSPYAISQGTLVANSNYTIQFTSSALTVTSATLTVTANSQTKVYGQPDPALTYMASGFQFSDTAASVLSGSPTRAAGQNVGSYAISQGTLAANTSYTIQFMGNTLTITQAALTITASNGSMTYGGPVFPVTPIYSGFVNGDGSSSLTTQPACGTTATSSSPVGAYVSACSAAVDSNYTISYSAGVVTVAQANTTTGVVSSVNPSTYMQLVTFTATVSPQYNGTTPTGTVSFYNNGSLMGTSTLNVIACGTPPCPDQGSFNTTSLSDNVLDNVTAVYSGDSNFISSTSPAFTETVQPAPVVNLQPLFLSFGNQNVSTTSKAAVITLSNIGDAALTISTNGIAITGSNSGDFAQTNNCGSSLAASKSCTINVAFTPTATGVRTASLQITDNDDDGANAQQIVSLTGAGLTTITGSSLYTDAIFAGANGCASLTLSGGSSVNSFNSSQGYSSSNQNNGGNVRTNGNVALNGSTSAIYGTAAVPWTTTGTCSKTAVTGLTASGGAQVTGGLVPLNGPVTYPVPPSPSPAPPTSTQSISGSCGSISGCSNTGSGSKPITLLPGQYGNLSVSGGTTAHFTKGTYNINSLTISGKSILYVDSGPVVINLAGASLSGASPAMDMSGGSIQNPSGVPANLQFVYAGSRGVNLSGGTASYATVYAPLALVNMSGGTDFFGSIIGSTVTSSGGTAVHYDANLSSIHVGNYILFTATVNNLSNLGSSQVKLYLTDSSISFTAGGTNYNLPVPNAVLTLNSKAASTPTTAFDLTNNRWSTQVPASGLTGNTFVTGLAFKVPANFPTGIQNVAWSASFSTDTPGVVLQWQWGAAVYTSLSTTYATGTTSATNNVLGINAEDGADPAGTPENYKQYVTFGGTGGGLNNYTGYLSTGAGVVPTIAPMSVSPSSLEFLAQNQGTTSATSMSAVLTNNDSNSHAISSIAIMGTNASNFALVTTGANNCLSTPNLASGASCTLYVTFTPSDIGTRTAKIAINDDANNSPQTVYLSGIGQ